MDKRLPLISRQNGDRIKIIGLLDCRNCIDIFDECEKHFESAGKNADDRKYYSKYMLSKRETDSSHFHRDIFLTTVACGNAVSSTE